MRRGIIDTRLLSLARELDRSCRFARLNAGARREFRDWPDRGMPVK